MHRFFVTDGCMYKDKIKIDGDDAAHILKVLRLRVGDEIIVCDGKEKDYLCTIASLEKKNVVCSITEVKENAAEPPLKLDLYQGFPKSAKMDLIIQKCTELGVSSVTPVYTERVVVRQYEDRDLDDRVERWQRIAEEASKQSGRGRIPKVCGPVSFKDVISRLKDYDISIIPYEKESCNGLKQFARGKNNTRSAAVLIGPEGGFTEEEVSMAKNAGAVPVTLGPRILRTETAGFVCLSILMYELGDVGGNI